MNSYGLVFVTVVITAACCFAIYCYTDDFRPIKRWRKMRTPSCIECKHGYDDESNEKIGEFCKRLAKAVGR